MSAPDPSGDRELRHVDMSGGGPRLRQASDDRRTPDRLTRSQQSSGEILAVVGVHRDRRRTADEHVRSAVRRVVAIDRHTRGVGWDVQVVVGCGHLHLATPTEVVRDRRDGDASRTRLHHSAVRSDHDLVGVVAVGRSRLVRRELVGREVGGAEPRGCEYEDRDDRHADAHSLREAATEDEQPQREGSHDGGYDEHGNAQIVDGCVEDEKSHRNGHDRQANQHGDAPHRLGHPDLLDMSVHVSA